MRPPLTLINVIAWIIVLGIANSAMAQVELSFELPEQSPSSLSNVSGANVSGEVHSPPSRSIPPLTSSAELDALFKGGSDSFVAHAIGHAEGTRTVDGEKTDAYHGHIDPGNGVWNLGSFSYQHGAQSPEEADLKQIDRLKSQAVDLHKQAKEQGLNLDLAEDLNGLDLANQAPLAALGEAGYIEWLAQARAIGLRGSEAIVWARTRSFLDPDTRQWNAPGLGNSVDHITHDQARRQQAIAQVIERRSFSEASSLAVSVSESSSFRSGGTFENGTKDIYSAPEALAQAISTDSGLGNAKEPDVLPGATQAEDEKVVDLILSLDLPEIS